MKLISVVGARSNFIKIVPFIYYIEVYNKTHSSKVEHLLVHTGQYYDDTISIQCSEADINLDIGNGSYTEQVGQTMIAFEKMTKMEKPDWVVVAWDMNATMACSDIAKKL